MQESALTASSGEDTDTAEKKQEMLIKQANLRTQQEQMKVDDLENKDIFDHGSGDVEEYVSFSHQPANSGEEVSEDDEILANRTKHLPALKIKNSGSSNSKYSLPTVFSKDLPATFKAH